MEYLNDRTYRRGDDVEVEVTVEAEKAKTTEGLVYEYTYALLRGARGSKIELWGDAPKVAGDKAAIVLTGKIERAVDDDYRAQGGVQGRIPGSKVDFDPICGLDRPLKVEGGDDQNLMKLE